MKHKGGVKMKITVYDHARHGNGLELQKTSTGTFRLFDSENGEYISFIESDMKSMEKKLKMDNWKKRIIII